MSEKFRYKFYGKDTLIWEPVQSVETFPSGLIRIQRTAMCRRDRSNPARNRLEINGILPTINGLEYRDLPRIYPEAQEEDLGNGFVRFSVTAYTRQRDSFNLRRRQRFSELAFYNGQRATLPVIRLQYAVLQSNSVRPNNPFSDITFAFTLSGELLRISSANIELRTLERDNFGFFDEVTEVWGVRTDQALAAPEQT